MDRQIWTIYLSWKKIIDISQQWKLYCNYKKNCNFS